MDSMRCYGVGPSRATPGAAAYDLLGRIDTLIWPGQVKMIPVGIWLAIPPGYAALVLPRSGLASKKRLAPANTPGLIDPDYRGQVFVALCNYGRLPRRVRAGQRIAQLLIISAANVEIEVVDSILALGDTERGAGGFGSTGQ